MADFLVERGRILEALVGQLPVEARVVGFIDPLSIYSVAFRREFQAEKEIGQSCGSTRHQPLQKYLCALRENAVSILSSFKLKYGRSRSKSGENQPHENTQNGSVRSDPLAGRSGGYAARSN